MPPLASVSGCSPPAAAAGALGIVGLPLHYPRIPITGIVGSDIAHAVLAVTLTAVAVKAVL
jgi:hypothetical protein